MDIHLSSDFAEQVRQVLDVLAAQFGTTATHLFGVMVRHHWIVGLLQTALAGVAALVVIAVLVGITKPAFEDIENQTFGVWLFLALVVVCLLLIAAGGVPRLVNPEYYAVKDILASVAGLGGGQ